MKMRRDPCIAETIVRLVDRIAPGHAIQNIRIVRAKRNPAQCRASHRSIWQETNAVRRLRPMTPVAESPRLVAAPDHSLWRLAALGRGFPTPAQAPGRRHQRSGVVEVQNAEKPG